MVNNQRVRKTFLTQAEAEAFERGEKFSREGSIGAVFKHGCDRFWAGTRNERNAIRHTEWMIRYFGPTKPVTSITTAAVEDMVDYLKHEVGNANGTINRKLAALSKLLDHARKREFIDRKPEIEYQKESEGRLRFLTPEEEERIFSHLEGKYYYFAVFLLYTGCRIGEALNLQWQDITTNGGSPMVTFWKTKTDQPRSVPLVGRAQGALQYTKGEGWITPFSNINYDYFNLKWNEAKALAGLGKDAQVVPHVLRHTCASRLVQRGADIYRVKKWLGHSNISVTERYAKLRVTDLEGAAKLLE